MEKTVREICLICRGERWIPDHRDPSRSRPCPYCDQLGWVLISPANFGDAAGELSPPAAPEETKPSPGPRRTRKK